MFILETERARAISTKFLIPGDLQILLATFAKIVFPPLLVAILNFCIIHKHVFILEMERARAILTNFFTHNVATESTGEFLPNRFPATFGGHLECLRKMQRCVYLRNGAS